MGRQRKPARPDLHESRAAHPSACKFAFARTWRRAWWREELARCQGDAVREGHLGRARAPPSSSDGNSAAAQEAERSQREEAEQRAREDAERRQREEAERARAADLEAAGSKRHETLQTWLTSSGRLSRPLSDGYLFWQVVNLLSDQTAHTTDVCAMLGVEIGDSGSLDSLLNYAKKGSEQLRRPALALIVTWAE